MSFLSKKQNKKTKQKKNPKNSSGFCVVSASQAIPGNYCSSSANTPVDTRFLANFQ